MKKIFIPFVGLALLAGKCNEKKPVDPPVTSTPDACFTVDKQIADVGETFTFNSGCSQNGTKFFWKFGNGGSDTIANPKYAYPNVSDIGVKKVTLRVTSADGTKSDTVSKNITVGHRYCASFVINKMDMKQGSGLDWDSDGSGPDVFIQYGNNLSNLIYSTETNVVNDVKLSDFPLTVMTQGALITNEDWYFKLVEKSSTGNRVMSTFKFNCAAAPKPVKLTGTDPNNEILLNVDVKP